MDFKTVNRQIILWLSAILSLYLLYRLSSVLTPFLISFGLAYVANPLIEKIEGKKIPRTLAVTIVFTLIVIFILLVLLVAIPVLINQIINFIHALPNYYLWAQENLFPWFESVFSVDLSANEEGGLKELFSSNIPLIKNISKQIMSAMSSSALAFAGFIASLLLIPMLSFYVMRDWHPITESMESLIPRAYTKSVMSFLYDSDEMLSGFLRGQFTVMLILATVYSIGLSIVGLKYGLLIGVIAGLISFIPYLGASTGIAIGLIVAWFQFDGSLFYLAGVGIVFGIGQGLESFFLTPVLIGDKLGMHPIAVIFALMVGGALFGFFGILLALPVCAVLMVALRRAYSVYRRSELYTTPKKL